MKYEAMSHIRAAFPRIQYYYCIIDVERAKLSFQHYHYHTMMIVAEKMKYSIIRTSSQYSAIDESTIVMIIEMYHKYLSIEYLNCNEGLHVQYDSQSEYMGSDNAYFHYHPSFL